MRTSRTADVLYEEERKARQFDGKYKKNVYALERLRRDDWHFVAGNKRASDVCRFCKVVQEPAKFQLAEDGGNISL
jgi:hypothetical protein